MNYTAIVAKGAAVLDAYMPGWRDRMNLDTLDLASTEACVLGQLHSSSYYNGRNEIKNYLGFSNFDAAEYGFSCDEIDDYPALTNEWRRVILSPTPTAARRPHESSPGVVDDEFIIGLMRDLYTGTQTVVQVALELMGRPQSDQTLVDMLITRS